MGIVTTLCGCATSNKQQPVTQDTTQEVRMPIFNGDSAYNYVDKQVAFGYRIPGSEAHRKTADWLIAELSRHKATVITQETIVTAYDGTRLPICNIIAQFYPEKEQRVALAAHWDSRPFADRDPNPAYHNSPIDGANDGASGVGVLLEIARHLGEYPPNVGIDIILFDAEDYGAPEWVEGDTGDTWALGSQYWATHTHTPGYKARFGILLDMVGATGIGFYREYFSDLYAPHIIDKVWKCAADMGFEGLFINDYGGAITDDHLNMIQAGIPTIDIIQFDPNSATGFFPQWHTREDNMKHIDIGMLTAVGQTVLGVIYGEK